MLSGYDQKSNIVLSDSKERVYSMDEGVEEIPLGLYLVKGDMMYVRRLFAHARVPLRAAYCTRVYSILIGEIDEERDSSIDLSTIRADPIPPIRY